MYSGSEENMQPKKEKTFFFPSENAYQTIFLYKIVWKTVFC